MRYVSPIVISEIICLTSAILLVWKDRKVFWKVITCYIAIALGTELYAIYLASKHIHNLWLFNIFLIFESSTILYGLYCCLKEYTSPKSIFFIGSGVVYLTYFIFFFTHSFTDANTLTISVMSVFFTLYCLYYYYLLLKDENFINIKTHPEFWWVTGVLFYYFGSTMSNIFDGLFTIKIIGVATLRYCIYVLLNLILYSLWVYSFICRMKQRKLHS
ncbi:hypothetical protein [Pedobacter alluvionis]|uniref:YhhN-like protein n=1 Tax=Pedobacter alluvionis TaxID=475253 RepID=A0A497Y6A3_9SPHI|nr:hypothetical protein [Pedobacter alluvionis]RLJ77627.1 hypothetical protein BCL90_2726 [Pedobacter alluvionis]TFB33166.1 hypothetical protein E3V97_03740 [Pedobacter alluvionis]